MPMQKGRVHWVLPRNNGRGQGERFTKREMRGTIDEQVFVAVNFCSVPPSSLVVMYIQFIIQGTRRNTVSR